MDGRLLMELQSREADLSKGFDETKQILIPQHSHALTYKESMYAKRCDVCGNKHLYITYRCRDNNNCDFDCCLECSVPSS